jgi:hypothetical protein
MKNPQIQYHSEAITNYTLDSSIHLVGIESFICMHLYNTIAIHRKDSFLLLNCFHLYQFDNNFRFFLCYNDRHHAVKCLQTIAAQFSDFQIPYKITLLNEFQISPETLFYLKMRSNGTLSAR